MTAVPTSPTAEEIRRFQAKTRAVGDCLLWTGQKDKDGYRVALWLVNRPIPEGFVVNHTCRHRACVNPAHLLTITRSQNSLRDSASVAYVNSQKTHCRLGHPFDRAYGGQRYCSTCEKVKRQRLKAKWKAEGILKI
jgi:hypothetical protein